MTDALRERFGKYHVLEKIAQGGMAEVYKVKTVGIAGFEKIQALKRILPSSAREGRFIRSFIDEARIAVELTHRNIVQVFDFGKADGELFLAMELIEGKDLRSAMSDATAKRLPCPIPVAAYVIAEVAAGLDYAHRKTDGYGGTLGIVHCDVSPSNVMLSTDGYIKILDFGIARASFASALERRRLRGKPRYMAPEQTIGEPPTPAADVFALGIIAWELFTGKPLYKGADLKAILEAVRKYTPPRLDTIDPAIPAEIVNAVAKCLQREPAQRGTTADVVAAFTRTAFLGGARPTAKWLADLDASGEAGPISWAPEVTSISVPAPEPPVRTSARSITQSLANIPAQLADFGAGTPGWKRGIPEDFGTHSIERELPGVPEEKPATTDHLERPSSTEILPRPAMDQWTARATTMGLSRLANLVPEPRTVDTELPSREFNVVTTPAAIPRFEEPDEVTHDPLEPGSSSPLEPGSSSVYGRTIDRPVGEATSYDELEVDQQQQSLDRPGEEPIDDDLGAMTEGVLADRRRSVLVAVTLDGGTPELRHGVIASLGSLAYQRGAVVIAQDDASLVTAFGLEVAGEDDVAIAMGWALDAGSLARDAAGDDAPLVVKIGARTGVATSTNVIPADAVDEARGLAREAQPDRPLFLGTTGRVTSSLYALREVTTSRRAVRGRSKAIEVIGPRGFDERDRQRLERRGKLFGRARQLAELDGWLGRSIAANRRLAVLVTGAAGTGKSRLVAEFIAQRQAATELRVVSISASPASRFAPFALVIDLYQAALGLPPARGRFARGQVTQRLVQAMTQAGGKPDRVRTVAQDLDRAMELRDGVGVAAPEVADLRPRISAGLAAFRVLTGAHAYAGRPLVTIIEDVHHADGASLEVLRHTLAVPASGPELLVMTARPDGDFVGAPPPVDVVISVGDLVGGELRGMIADRLGDAATAFNIAAVLARGGGNPLFVEELAQAVREAGGNVPASARDVVAARLDRLGPKAKSALRFAAVIGGTVRVRILEELLGTGSGAPGTVEITHELEDEIDELVEAGLLVRPESAVHSTEGELTFARGLVREVVYESMSARTQRESHARVGRLLASRFFAGRDEPPGVIAEHLERGGELAGAAAFWLRAGRLAVRASDAEGAVAHFTRTLSLERDLAKGGAFATPQSITRRREALAGREEARRLLGDLASDPGDLDELAHLCAGQPGRLADVALRRAQRMLRIGDFANAHVATVVAEDHAVAAGDDRLRGEALRIRSEILERVGRFDEALAVVGVARDLFHRRGAIHEEMAAMIGRGRIHLLRAHYEAAHDAYGPVLAMIEKTGDPWLERIAKNHVAVIEMCLGNFTGAMDAARRSLELCRRYGDRAREGEALSVAAIILMEVGLYDEAAAMFDDALEVLERTASRWSRADCLIYAGANDIRRGHPGGLEMIGAALGDARALGARYLEANALVARAGAHIRLGDFASAIEDARAGTEAARAVTLVGYEIVGLARLALALERTGDSASAREHAQRAIALLDQQRYLEASEEDVLLACSDVLRSRELAERGRASAQKKLDGLVEPAWRAAYAAIPEVRALLG